MRDLPLVKIRGDAAALRLPIDRSAVRTQGLLALFVFRDPVPKQDAINKVSERACPFERGKLEARGKKEE